MKWRWVRIKFPPNPERSLDFEKLWSKVLMSRQRPEKDWVQVKTDAGRGSEVSNSRSRPKDSKVWVKTERCRRSTILKSRQLTRTKSKSRQILRRSVWVNADTWRGSKVKSWPIQEEDWVQVKKETRNKLCLKRVFRCQSQDWAQCSRVHDKTMKNFSWTRSSDGLDNTGWLLAVVIQYTVLLQPHEQWLMGELCSEHNKQQTVVWNTGKNHFWKQLGCQNIKYFTHDFTFHYESIHKPLRSNIDLQNVWIMPTACFWSPHQPMWTSERGCTGAVGC